MPKDSEEEKWFRLNGVRPGSGRGGPDPGNSDQLVALARAILRCGRDFATPLLMLDRDQVGYQYDLLQKLLKPDATFYAVKANTNPTLVRFLAKEKNSGFDAASAGELFLLKSLGVTGDRIVFSHPLKDREALEMIRRVQPGAIAVDSLAGLEQLLGDWPRKSLYQPTLLLRIPAPDSDLNKFGPLMYFTNGEQQSGRTRIRVDASEALSILQAAHASGRFSKLGVAFHVGTQCTQASRFLRILAICRRHLIEPLAKLDVKISVINVGGGFSDRRSVGSKRRSYEDVLTEIGAHLQAAKRALRGVEFWIEPGRALVADAGTVVTEILDRRLATAGHFSQEIREDLKLTGPKQHTRKVQRLTICDSLYINLLGQAHDHRQYELIPFTRDEDREFAEKPIPSVVYGKSCDGFDRLTHEHRFEFPQDIDTGDFALIPCAGAYSLTTATHFNGFPNSDVVIYRRSGEQFEARIDRSERPWTATDSRNGAKVNGAIVRNLVQKKRALPRPPRSS